MKTIGTVARVAADALSNVPGASSTDPIFAVIEAHKAANLNWPAELKRHDVDHLDCKAAGDRESEAYEMFWHTIPRTAAGMAAYFHHLQEPRWPVLILTSPSARTSVIDHGLHSHRRRARRRNEVSNT